MRRVLAMSAVVVLAASPVPRRAPAPAFQLHRTIAGAAFDPGAHQPLFILVIGSDVRSGDPVKGHSDAMHVVAINIDQRRGTILDIPRDIWMNVPGRGMTKINDSLIVGGPSKTAETVTALTGIPIHYWAVVDFSRFIEIVDKLGGLNVDVPYHMADTYSGAFFEQGPTHMNGDEVLAISRNRHDAIGGDFGRSVNQGLVLISAFKKFRAEATDPMTMLKYFETFRAEVTSDVGIGDLLTLANIALNIDPANIANVLTPLHTGMVGAASVDLLDPAAATVFAGIRDDGIL